MKCSERVLFNCKKSITGKFDSNYCTILCKQKECDRSYVLVKLVHDSIPCAWCDGEVGVGNKCFVCAEHTNYPLCFGCISVLEPLGDGIELLINMDRAKTAMFDEKDMDYYLNNMNQEEIIAQVAADVRRLEQKAEEQFRRNHNKNSNKTEIINLLSDDE